jgi:hypothetical protein
MIVEQVLLDVIWARGFVWGGRRGRQGISKSKDKCLFTAEITEDTEGRRGRIKTGGEEGQKLGFPPTTGGARDIEKASEPSAHNAGD